MNESAHRLFSSPTTSQRFYFFGGEALTSLSIVRSGAESAKIATPPFRPKLAVIADTPAGGFSPSPAVQLSFSRQELHKGKPQAYGHRIVFGQVTVVGSESSFLFDVVRGVVGVVMTHYCLRSV